MLDRSACCRRRPSRHGHRNGARVRGDRGAHDVIVRGIRVRRTLLEHALRWAIEQTHAAGRPVRLLDIASGPGRYIQETIHTLNTIPISAVLRDYKQENLNAAARLRDQFGLANVTVTLGDKTIDSFTIQPKQELIRKPTITAAQLGTADVVDIKISVDKTYIPAVVTGGANRDPRELGVRVFHAYVQPTS